METVKGTLSFRSIETFGINQGSQPAQLLHGFNFCSKIIFYIYDSIAPLYTLIFFGYLYTGTADDVGGQLKSMYTINRV